MSGYQPKVLLREIDGKYVAGLTEEELFARYDACEDLAQQLVPYVTRKRAENPSWSLDETLSKVEAGVDNKVADGQWDISRDEIVWIMGRVRQALAAEGGVS
ncbi:hypothetical protein [Paraburkholderia sp. C35]|uniref:hypothetical protein n=1 Tax=Paraburkholderia sp. C35 TaxID=2126993 RepID=UPI001EF50E82|nr:hypothetical protein [Paraburkholderia sp. C35]